MTSRRISVIYVNPSPTPTRTEKRFLPLDRGVAGVRLHPAAPAAPSAAAPRLKNKAQRVEKLILAGEARGGAPPRAPKRRFWPRGHRGPRRGRSRRARAKSGPGADGADGVAELPLLSQSPVQQKVTKSATWGGCGFIGGLKLAGNAWGGAPFAPAETRIPKKTASRFGVPQRSQDRPRKPTPQNRAVEFQ